MSRPIFSKEYPVDTEEITKIYQDCARKNGLSVLFTEGSNAQIHIHIYQGDRFEAGRAVMQGHNVHAHDILFHQIWHQTKEIINLQTLAGELNTLRDELQKSARNAEDYAEIGAIADAEIEAKKGNGPKSLSALAKAGKWTLSIAEKIGVAVAAAAIKAACGF